MCIDIPYRLLATKQETHIFPPGIFLAFFTGLCIIGQQSILYNGIFRNIINLSNEAKTNFKSNWGSVWDTAGGYKQRQILGAING